MDMAAANATELPRLGKPRINPQKNIAPMMITCQDPLSICAYQSFDGMIPTIETIIPSVSPPHQGDAVDALEGGEEEPLAALLEALPLFQLTLWPSKTSL